MRRLVLLILLIAAPSAQAHSGYVDIKQNAFMPQELNVTEGVLVLWRWDGPDLNHTVTGDFFESDPGKDPVRVNHEVGDTFPVLFEKAGTYPYYCRVHPEMTGSVVVEEPAAVDTTPPKLTGVEAAVRGDRAVIGFVVNERSSVIAEIRRPGARKVLRSSLRFVKPGARTTAIGLSGLGQGRFSIRVKAQDDGGNFSRPAVVGVHR